MMPNELAKPNLAYLKGCTLHASPNTSNFSCCFDSAYHKHLINLIFNLNSEMHNSAFNKGICVNFIQVITCIQNQIGKIF